MTCILADAHVHIQQKYDLSSFLDACLDNFSIARQQFPLDSPSAYFLLLAETKGNSRFEELQHGVYTSQQLQFTPLEEGRTLYAKTENEERLYIVAGKQIVTKEKLEILSLGLDSHYPDGNSLEKALHDLSQRDHCITVLPWGVGKWLGNRGKIIEETVETWQGDTPLFLGDNGNRPHFWTLPQIFKDAAQKGIYNLPGSDPLSLPRHEKRAGSFGFTLSASLDDNTPFTSLYNQLVATSQDIAVYGQLNKGVNFIKEQIYMQIDKRL